MTFNDEISRWNTRFRYDFWWRQKHGIAFGSPEHRAANQIDISFEYFESRMYEKAITDYREEKKKRKEYEKTGMWIKESTEVSDDLWNKLDMNTLKNI